jgi:tetratricopeptide (TPR) repeat protein
MTELGIVLRFLREGQGWSQEALAKATGIPAKRINDYEWGRKPLKRERLERLIAAMGLPPERIEATLHCLEDNRASARAPGGGADRFEAGRRRIEAVAQRAAKLVARFVRELLSLVTLEGEILRAQQQAEFLWARLKGQPPEARPALVKSVRKFWHWGLCVKVAAEAFAKVGNAPREALELARLALLIAERVPGEQAWRWRLQGYALVHVANCLRACSDLHEAAKTFARAKELWKKGAPGDPGLLDETWLLWFEAVLRRAQRQFAEALRLIEEALAADQGELRAQILLSKSHILETIGDPARAIEAIWQAAPLIDAQRQPRLAFGLRFNLLVNLCHQDRATEAAEELGRVRALAERLGGVVDLMRCVWLGGKVAAGLGRRTEARAAFEQVRKAFNAPESAYNCAQVTMDLALVLLEEGRTGAARTLAEEMLQTFKALGIHREALAALDLFCKAAQQETATVDLARRVARYLHRAQHDPELRFDIEEEAEAS